jgi:hypothetical protein
MRFLVGWFTVCVFGLGCGGGVRPPALTEAKVTVLLAGQPLPNALVTFTPAASHYGADAIASGVTDAQGVAQLVCGTKPGACIGLNRVTVMEAPLGEEARSDDPQAQAKASKQLKELKNRPIPPRYATLADGGIEVEIKAGQVEYKLELTRP